MTLDETRKNAVKNAINEHYAVISFKVDGTIKDANEKFLNLFGYKLDEIVDKHHKIFCEEEYIKSNEYKKFWNDLSNGKVQTEEFKRIKKNGESVFIQASYQPLKNEYNQVFEILKFAQDITNRKLQSLNYEAQINAINKSQATIEFDTNGIILTANDNFLKSMGYELNELIGKHHSIFCEKDYINSNEYKTFWERLKEGTFDTGKYIRVAKNGKKVWIQATYTPILDINNKPIKIVKFAQDITKLESIQKDVLTGLFISEKLILDIPENDKNNLAILSIDDFSFLNDFYGDEIANKFIIEFSKLLTSYLNDDYKIYRIYGAKFAILNWKLANNEFYETIYDFINYMKNTYIDLGIKKFNLVTTCGISYESNEKIIHTADIVNKFAKKQLKNILQYSEELNIEKKFEENIYWSEKISQALKEDRIIVYYQPIFNNKSNKIEKYESLVRLQDTNADIVSPYKFLEISKKSKQYIDITKKVIEKSFEKFKNFDYEFSINLTVEDILDKDLSNFLFSKIAEFDISNRLVIELVESEKITTYEPIYDFIAKIKDIGCKVAIDDFGTGYSNFEYLVKIDADFVKIDGSIIKRILEDENSLEIVKSIIQFCKKMNIKIIAEFVSNIELQEKVKELGITYSQGFYLGEPNKNLVDEKSI